MFIKTTGHPLLVSSSHVDPDPREEALAYDKFALEVYKATEGGTILVGHVPIELSQLLNYF